LVATWEDVWEALPADVRLVLTPPEPAASKEGVPSSLFEAAQLPPSEKRVFALMRADESIHIDQLVERLTSYLSSSEIFAALFELELSGRIRQMPGKYFVRTM
jgi:DNA processing protein